MSVTLSGITLPNSLQNSAEFSAQQVSMTTQRTLAGSVVVYTGQRANGFPIELVSGADFGWIKRSVVIQLHELSKQAGLVMTLVFKGTTYRVMFDNTQQGAFEAVPVIPYSSPTDNDYYRCTMKLITV